MKTHQNIIGRQYGYRKNALRSIRRFRAKHRASGFRFWVNRIDNGCFEVCGHAL